MPEYPTPAEPFLIGLRHGLLETAAGSMEARESDLTIEAGDIMVRGVPGRRVPIAEIMAHRQPRQIIGQANTRAGSRTHIVNSFAAHFAEVEVDPNTGQVRVTAYVAAHDCGRPINMMGVEGQIEGGVMQGIGYALTEEMAVDQESGVPSAANLDTFKIPIAADIPSHFETIVVEVDDPVGPYGAKGIGEPPLAPPAAAIANAVYDATGVRIRDLPITPEKIVAGLRKQFPRPFSRSPLPLGEG